MVVGLFNMCDVEKLVFCVQIRPAIYNYNSKEYTDRKIIKSSWEEVSKEMNMTVTQCKAKWSILRNSYGRFLRDESKISSGLISKKRRKVWHLAEAMSFLKDFLVRPPLKRTLDSTFKSSDDNSMLNIPIDNASNESQNSLDEQNAVSTKQAAAEIDTLADPMVEYFKSKFKKTESEDENITFFKSLLPDIRKLSSRRQRQIKYEFLSNLNQLLDEEEKEIGVPVVTWESLEEGNRQI